jgi:hypothetical protein
VVEEGFDQRHILIGDDTQRLHSDSHPEQ